MLNHALNKEKGLFLCSAINPLLEKYHESYVLNQLSPLFKIFENGPADFLLAENLDPIIVPRNNFILNKKEVYGIFLFSESLESSLPLLMYKKIRWRRLTDFGEDKEFVHFSDLMKEKNILFNSKIENEKIYLDVENILKKISSSLRDDEIEVNCFSLSEKKCSTKYAFSIDEFFSAKSFIEIYKNGTSLK